MVYFLIYRGACVMHLKLESAPSVCNIHAVVFFSKWLQVAMKHYLISHKKILVCECAPLKPYIIHLIKVASYKRHGLWNHTQIHCLFNIFLILTSKLTLKLPITCLLWGKSTCHRWIPSPKASDATSVLMSSDHDTYTISHIYYIPRNVRAACALLCIVVVCYQSVFPITLQCWFTGIVAIRKFSQCQCRNFEQFM